MKKNKNTISKSRLTQCAERNIGSNSLPEHLSKMSLDNAMDLIEELEIHQVELKIQNDELCRIQKELEETRDSYVNLYDFAPVGYITIDLNGLIIKANLTIATMLVTERAALMNCLFSRFILKNDQEIYYHHQNIILETKTPQSYRLRLVNKNRCEFYTNIECSFVENDKSIRIVISDISEQKKLEEQLLQSQKMESLGILAGGIAHDFNNILTAMIGFTELAKDDAEKESPLVEKLDEVLIGGKRAKLLVQQILSFSRQVPGEKKPFQLDLLAMEVTKLLRSTLPVTIEIYINIGIDTPHIIGDKSQIHQVILNLCTNAVQAIEGGTGSIVLYLDKIILDKTKAKRFNNLKPGEYVNLCVSDTGVGMAPEVLDRIFEPFFSTKGPDRGTGMGLSVVEGVVQSHNGYITAESHPQKGTTFNVYLPLYKFRVNSQLKSK